MSTATLDSVPVAARPRLRWWREVFYVIAIYVVYSSVRNQFGSAGGPSGQSNRIAYEHGIDIIQIQRFLHLDFEPALQRWYLDLPANGWIGFWNVFYGTAHFIVTAVALIWLFRRMPERYPLWRNTLALTTGLALIGFALYPLMPPRLLDSCGPYGACVHYGFVDTLKEIGGLWSFDSGTMQKISNQYAAMPSLHCAWAIWSVLVLWPGVRRRGARVLLAGYPFVTLFAIVVTANHYWIDAVGGAAVLGAGFLLARVVTVRLNQRTPRGVEAVVP
jgi:hypothetical protein